MPGQCKKCMLDWGGTRAPQALPLRVGRWRGLLSLRCFSYMIYTSDWSHPPIGELLRFAASCPKEGCVFVVFDASRFEIQRHVFGKRVMGTDSQKIPVPEATQLELSP